jgi:hypothetical protein
LAINWAVDEVSNGMALAHLVVECLSGLLHLGIAHLASIGQGYRIIAERIA